MLKRKLIAVMSSAALLSTLVGNAMAATSFTDVSADSPYASYIQDLSSKGIVSGVGNGQFAPTKTLTRAEMATFLVRAFGIPQNTSSSVAFTDIRGHWAESYIKSAYAAGMIAGKSATTFAPDAPVTREEAAQMVWNYLSKNGVQPSSGVYNLPNIGKLDSWAQSAVGNLMTHQLVGPSNFSDWTASMNRQEAAAVIDLAMQALEQANTQQPQPQPQPLPPVQTGGSIQYPFDATQIVINPTTNSNNLIDNGDGTFSLGNIKMTNSFINGYSKEEFTSHLQLFSQVKFKFDGNKVTVTVPDSGSSSVYWVIGGPDGGWNGEGPKTMTESDRVGVRLFNHDNAHTYAGAALLYQNGQWVVKYPNL
ncbi:hypothetical protein DNHGIG_32110 [Collibacillus ludicampi]|uniref:SLH domain-containing protein n=1 Tax=Collibacillus ludicampi TaxID=2771369 RepID=A0AAV4LIK2_9BACL|nr:S-layer homology domain-containing protein [Collibacillus ludicampi]GIM47662.1 hypothetical protein DNHGIG_32110 [Collibacillus ludicampi]